MVWVMKSTILPWTSGCFLRNRASRCLLRLSNSRRSCGVIDAMVCHHYFRGFLGRFFLRSCSASQRSSAWATAECGRMLPITRDGNPSFLRSSSRCSTSMYTSSGSRHFFSNARRCFQKCPSSKRSLSASSAWSPFGAFLRSHRCHGSGPAAVFLRSHLQREARLRRK